MSITLLAQIASRTDQRFVNGDLHMVKSVLRTLDVLEKLSLRDEELSITELHEELDLPLSTVHRLLDTLVARGYASQNMESKRYGPGSRLLEIAERAKMNRRFQPRQYSYQFLVELVSATGETSNLVMPQDGEMVYVDQVLGRHSVRMFAEVGRRVPKYCTGSGKVVLAFQEPISLKHYFGSVTLEQRTPKTSTDIEKLHQQLTIIRRQGFAIDDEEFETGVRCVAAPVVDSTGTCIAAMSVSGPAERLTQARAEELGPVVSEIASRCSDLLGHWKPASS